MASLRKRKISFRAVVDRIEDGRWVVLSTMGRGQMVLPVRLFGGRVREGETFDVTWRPNRRAEKRLRSDVAALQRRLIKRSKVVS
jgi:hypothetical protein